MTAIEKLREIRNDVVNDGFTYGIHWHDLQDSIYVLQNP